MEKAKKLLVTYSPLLLVVFLTIPAMLPLFKSGFFPMHDDQQVARLYELDRALAAGQFPARWVGDLGFGYGYPLFLFYPPFVYYLGEVFHLLLATSFIWSIKLVFAFAFLGASLAMYFWVKEHLGKTGAIIAAAFYTYAPYHAVDAYVRGALAELAAFIWLPAILWSADRMILKQEKKYWIWLGVFLALLMITHNLVFLPFLPLFIIYIGFLILQSKERQRALHYTVYAALLAAGLSAFFWLPALAERKFTLVDSILLTELANYKLHFVYPTQLWNSLWGYGGSTQGPLDGISFKIGKLHVVLAMAAPILWSVRYHVKRSEKTKHVFEYSILLVFLLALSAFMTTRYSQPVWEVFTSLRYLQFPWRFLTFTVVFSSFLAASMITAVFRLVNSHLLRVAIAAVTLALLLIPNLKLFQPQSYLNVGDDHYTNEEFLKWTISKTSFEFVPKGIETTTEFNPIEKRGITQVAISKNEIAASPYKILSGEGEIQVEDYMPGSLTLKTKSDVGLKLQLNTFDFPGWEVKVNGEKISPDSHDDLKRIRLYLSEGEHTISAKFKNTPIRSFSNFISSLSLLAVFLGLSGHKAILNSVHSGKASSP